MFLIAKLKSGFSFLQETEKDDLFKHDIGDNRYLTACVYDGNLMVHIRQYAEENGKMYPTKKGASFTERRWASLLRRLDDADRSVDLLKANQPVDYRQHLGGGYYLSVCKDFKCVDIRRYFLPNKWSVETPTRSGISLRVQEWRNLLIKIDELHKVLPELKNAKPCYVSEDHANREGYRSCSECNPFER